MSTQYDTKQQALEMGAFYVGYKDKKSRREALEAAEVTEQNMINPVAALLPPKKAAQFTSKIEVHTITNPDGIKVGLGIGRFRSGFDLWLIDQETGNAMRTWGKESSDRK